MTKPTPTWFEQRFPWQAFWKKQFTDYYVPKNLNFWYAFGILAILILLLQMVSGLFLAMHYKPDVALAFWSVETIMREVRAGWFIRYLHSSGASLCFVVLYLHIFRGLLYGSYKTPRELVWLLGMLLFVCVMAEAFMGYLLPWGQMSYWGAQVVINLFNTLPIIGEPIALWLRGDYVVSDVTLTRFFALHIIGIPLLLIVLGWAHIVALRQVGSNNPDGVDIYALKNEQGRPLDGIPFHPYYTVKDALAVGVFMLILASIVFFCPDLFGYFLEPVNFIPANPLVTPEHITPMWYFAPFYAILRAIPAWGGSALWGILALWLALLLLALLPWLDRCPVKSIRYRGINYKIALTMFTLSFLSLGYLGMAPLTAGHLLAAQIGSALYFLFFLAMPFYTANDLGKLPVPTRVQP